MQNDIGEHKLANPEKYESHKTGTCGECQRLGRDLMEMIQLKNNIYSNTYKPICTCEDRNTDYHLTVCCAEKILINKQVAKKWAEEMLAQAKYAKLSGASLIDLLNEIRKSL